MIFSRTPGKGYDIGFTKTETELRRCEWMKYWIRKEGSKYEVVDWDSGMLIQKGFKTVAECKTYLEGVLPRLEAVMKTDHYRKQVDKANAYRRANDIEEVLL